MFLGPFHEAAYNGVQSISVPKTFLLVLGSNFVQTSIDCQGIITHSAESLSQLSWRWRPEKSLRFYRRPKYYIYQLASSELPISRMCKSASVLLLRSLNWSMCSIGGKLSHWFSPIASVRRSGAFRPDTAAPQFLYWPPGPASCRRRLLFLLPSSERLPAPCIHSSIHSGVKKE